MAQSLPRLRMNLDFMPSPVADRPGLLIRDPYQFSDATLIIPPALVNCLQLFDGEQTELDLKEALVRLTGELDVGELQSHLTDALSSAGFLEDENYEAMRVERHAEFARSARREATHAGGAYPDQPEQLNETLSEYLGGEPPFVASNGLAGIAAPHVSPHGGFESYRAAYRLMGPELASRTFVILGTSHYGQPERFGLTRKAFVTPFGEAVTDLALVNRLAEEAGEAADMEDYCHAVEHSIEFQVVFLQYLYGPGVKILPILCGSFARSIYRGGKPEDDENVRRFLGSLGDLAAREGNKLFWVLGVDMAHMGARYGDQFTAIADDGEMLATAGEDRKRIERISSGDAPGFWDLIQDRRDALKWCGSSPFYTFLKAVPGVQGKLEHYQQWNIDEKSVVSFAGMGFRTS